MIEPEPGMPRFDYSASPDPIRADLAEAHRAVWEHIAKPGAWLTGAERVAVARETRRARACALCAKRKAALSPFAHPEQHAASAPLAAPLVDAIHRVATDAARLTRKWYEGLAAQGVTDERYVEALGVAVLAISVDAFHRALGLALEPLPEPELGDPSRERPQGLVRGEAWVPMIDPRRAAESELELLPRRGPLRAAYVLRALTLTPNEVRAWTQLAGAQYLSLRDMTYRETGRALDRAQMELVAGRVSALNACFY
jgi:hypothetical protein